MTNTGNVPRHLFRTYRIAQCKDAAPTAIPMRYTNPAMLNWHYRDASAVDAGKAAVKSSHEKTAGTGGFS